MERSLARILFGTDEQVAPACDLRAGPLALTMRGAKLWHLRVGELEVWHCVAFVFRDPDWGTPEPLIDEIDCSALDDGDLRVRASGHFPTLANVDFRVEIEGDSAGRILFSAHGIPREDVLCNRFGLCLMHPLSVVGRRIEVVHVDGRVSRSTFPMLIPPWPPFMLIRAIRHEYAHGRWAQCEFSGDCFEMEDQRNNSDASFKTYSRSNLMPRPYWLRAGWPVRQSVQLTVEGPIKRAARRRTPVAVRVGPDAGILPAIGTEIDAHDAQADEATLAALGGLRPALLHLSVGGDVDMVDWYGIRKLLEAAGARLRLDVELPDVSTAGGVLERLAAALAEAQIEPESLAVFPSEQRWVDLARSRFPSLPIGGGTPHFFAQLNRLEALGAVDFLTFTTSPTVHGAEDEPVMLTLQSLPWMVDTLRARYPKLPIRVGPSSLATRASPLGAQPASDGTRRVALASHDPRCRALFGAAWALGYIAQLAQKGVDAITLFRLSGRSGLIDSSDGRAIASPVYFVLSEMRLGARVYGTSVSQPTRVAALGLARPDRRQVMLANLTGEAVEIALEDWPAQCEASSLDARYWEGFDSWRSARRLARSARQCLEPYSVVVLAEPA
jgi:hypothetical protein